MNLGPKFYADIRQRRFIISGFSILFFFFFGGGVSKKNTLYIVPFLTFPVSSI